MHVDIGKPITAKTSNLYDKDFFYFSNDSNEQIKVSFNPGYGSNPQKLQVWQESLNKIAPPEDVKEKYDKAIIKKIAKEASIKDAIKSLTD